MNGRALVTSNHVNCHSNGRCFFRASGTYRIRYYAISHTSNWGQHYSKMLISGRSKYFVHNSLGRRWVKNTMDWTGLVHRGQWVEFWSYVSNSGNPYIYHAGSAAGPHSGVQIEYLGGRRPVASTYCTRHQHSGSGGWRDYCVNGADEFNNHYFRRSGPYIIVRKTGLYRIQAMALQHTNHVAQHDSNIFVNGQGRSYTHNSAMRNWAVNNNDVTWHLRRGQHIKVRYYVRGNGYIYHAGNANGHHSRLQVVYEGRYQQRPFWSGYCTHHARGGWHRYCLNRAEYNNPKGYFRVHGNGVIQILKHGLYRINGWSISLMHGNYHDSRPLSARILKNGHTVQYSHDYQNGWHRQTNNWIFRARRGDRFQVQYHANHYAYHSGNPHGHHSRVQIQFVHP